MSEAAVAALARECPATAARAATKRRSLQAELVWGEQAFDALHADWRRLADQSPGAVFFQTPEFLAAWTRAFRAGGKLVTVVVHDDGRPALIWPLIVERRGLISVARGAGVPIGQYDDILVEAGADPEPLFATALAALKEAARPDVIVLERVRADSGLRAALADAVPICWGEAAPFADLSQGAAATLAALKPAVMKKQRKRVRRFHKEGEVSFAFAECPVQAETWLAEALAMKRDWLKTTGRISRAFVRTATDDCLTDLARTLGRPGAEESRILVAKLSLNGRPAAYEAGFCHRGHYYIYLRAFAHELAAFGPGNVLTEQTLRWSAEHGITRYDMMAPRSRNKHEWQTDEVAVLDFALATSGIGRLYIAAILKRAAPALRDAFYALPLSLRSVVAKLAVRI